MKIVSIGGGPAGLYFAILMKRADPRHDVLVLERNRPDDTFGFGVVFSDATLETFRDADAETHAAITQAFAHWDDIDIHYAGQVLTSTGHGFAGMSRRKLLGILQARCAALGVTLRHQTEVADLGAYADADLVLGADGVNSWVRTAHAEWFRPRIDWRPNRFVWLGTTYPFRAFTFIFKEDEHGLWRVHAYRYDASHSTFILETTEATWRRAGLDGADEAATRAFAERLFARELDGHPILVNRSVWRAFPTIRNARWHHGRVVLVGDAAHTAHFSIGSGTKLAMEDVIALAGALQAQPDVPAALAAYEAERRPQVEAVQRAAQASLEWFEQTERYHGRLPPIQMAFSLLTRSLRVTHENLKARDPKLVATVDAWFAATAAAQSGRVVASAPPPPPMFTPLRLRELVLDNRVVVGPVCQGAAGDGTPTDWHLVHLGSRAVGGAGLVMAEVTDVSAEGRIAPGSTGLYTAEHAAAWTRIVRFVHGATRARIGLQLAHAAAADGTFPPTPADRDAVREAFVRAAALADAAGFDLLELRFARGGLLAACLSPRPDRRRDGDGDSLAERLRLPLEVFDAVRAAWPASKPMSVRIAARDAPDGGEPATGTERDAIAAGTDGGVTAEEAVEIARALKARGCDIVAVSSAPSAAEPPAAGRRLTHAPLSDRVRHEAGIPTMTVGHIASYADVNSILAAGRADLCVLARAHLYDPYWTRHAAHAQGVELPWPEPYAAVRTFQPRGWFRP